MAVALVAMALAARPAGAARTTTGTVERTCPSFRVLHNDRIGPAVFPAGNYTITLEATRFTCTRGAELFARFLEDYDGNLPGRWTVSPEGTGKASFSPAPARLGFSVELTARREEGGRNPDLGTLCPGTYTVNSTTVIRPLRFTRGQFLIYLPLGSGLGCNRAARLFTRFLGAGGTLPQPWRLTNQTATFFKPAHPARSSFRIEPLKGAGRR